jgi:hypothetical protein
MSVCKAITVRCDPYVGVRIFAKRKLLIYDVSFPYDNEAHKEGGWGRSLGRKKRTLEVKRK